MKGSVYLSVDSFTSFEVIHCLFKISIFGGAPLPSLVTVISVDQHHRCKLAFGFRFHSNPHLVKGWLLTAVCVQENKAVRSLKETHFVCRQAHNERICSFFSLCWQGLKGQRLIQKGRGSTYTQIQNLINSVEVKRRNRQWESYYNVLRSVAC